MYRFTILYDHHFLPKLSVIFRFLPVILFTLLPVTPLMNKVGVLLFKYFNRK